MVIFQAKMSNICWFQLLKCEGFMTVNEELLGFGLLIGQMKQFKDVTLDSGILWWAFPAIFWRFMDEMIDCENNRELRPLERGDIFMILTLSNKQCGTPELKSSAPVQKISLTKNSFSVFSFQNGKCVVTPPFLCVCVFFVRLCFCVFYVHVLKTFMASQPSCQPIHVTP